MGEAKQEEAKVEAKLEEKKEEKKEEKQEEEEEEKEEKKEEAKPSPPPPIILFVDLHCFGCAKKIEKCVLKCRGVEGVETDMVQNQLTIKGMVDPQALCSRIQKKTLKRARVLSPLPPAEGESKQEQVVPSQVSGVTTVEIHVNMHCEACAQQLRRKILKMRGVQTAETELSTGKVMVTGTMNGEKLTDYIHRRTGKLATIVPQPPKEEEKKEEAEKKAEEKPPEEKKEEKAEEKKEEKAEEKKEESAEGNKDGGGKEEKGGGEEQKKEGEGPTNVDIPNGADMVMKRMVYWNGNIISEEEMARRMMMHWMPVYVIERPPPPPQIFSDENPNACCIS
uniref:Heavy metal-associated isoprenylated plant protein 9 n=1 Tax=Elaeis guineensis var. tenera TaxID=51953 RepID=A0A6I9RXU3_ELAGV|nr:heavy metal-associated isoprenylated plant protein 9 [Elaeis guineensis]